MTASTLLPPPADLDSLVDIAQVRPAAVAGIAFLSGGQSGDLATARLGQDANVERAQRALRQRSKANRDTRRRVEVATDATAVAGPLVTTSGPARKAPTGPGETHVLRAEGTA